MIDGKTLQQWRAVLAAGWSPETAYPGTALLNCSTSARSRFV